MKIRFADQDGGKKIRRRVSAFNGEFKGAHKGTFFKRQQDDAMLHVHHPALCVKKLLIYRDHPSDVARMVLHWHCHQSRVLDQLV